jgi:hypothetical protein
MRFFLPIGRDVAGEREIYNHIKQLLSAVLGTPFTERQICSLHYQHDGQAYDVDVGQPHPVNGEIIVAILYGTLPARYYVCTRTHGVFQGQPMLIEAHEVLSVIEFEPE